MRDLERPSLEFADLPSDWPEHCDRLLAADQRGTSFARDLLRRWSMNAEWQELPSLRWEDMESAPYSWPELLGYAFAQEGFSEQARANAIDGFGNALKYFQPSLNKGTVWLEDVLSMRHLRYRRKDWRIALSAMDMMLEVLEKIPDNFPENNFEQYQIYSSLYHVATICMISELRERKSLEHSYISGTRLLSANHATLFSELSRLTANTEQGHHSYSGSTDRRVEINEWAKLDLRRQAIIDRLFVTIVKLNPPWAISGHFARDAILSHARELDLAWFRLAHEYSDVLVGERVAKALQALRTGNDALFAITHTELHFRGRRTYASDTLQVAVKGPQYEFTLQGEVAEEIGLHGDPVAAAV